MISSVVTSETSKQGVSVKQAFVKEAFEHEAFVHDHWKQEEMHLYKYSVQRIEWRRRIGKHGLERSCPPTS